MENKVTRSSGNIFADLGRPNPEEALIRSQLLVTLRQVIADRGLTQKDAAEMTGLAQPDVSRLLAGEFRGFSLSRLIRAVDRLGFDVEVAVKPKKAA